MQTEEPSSVPFRAEKIFLKGPDENTKKCNFVDENEMEKKKNERWNKIAQIWPKNGVKNKRKILVFKFQKTIASSINIVLNLQDSNQIFKFFKTFFLNLFSRTFAKTSF